MFWPNLPILELPSCLSHEWLTFLKRYYWLARQEYNKCLVTHFCAQAVFKLPVSNTFLTHKRIKFEIILVLDVPECVKRIRQIYAPNLRAR